MKKKKNVNYGMRNKNLFVKFLKKLKGYIGILRPQFWPPAIGPAIAGILGASNGEFHLNQFLYLIFSFACICGAAEAINDFFDRKFDKANNVKRFLKISSSGGSGILQTKIISPKEALIISILLFSISLIVAYKINITFFILIFIGVFFAITYSAPPIRWKNRGVFAGIVRGIAYGFITFNAGWYLVSDVFSIQPIFIGLLLTILVFGCSITADIADYSEDKENGIQTLPVVIGREKTAKMCSFFIIIFFFLSSLVYICGYLKLNILLLPLFFIGIYMAVSALRSNSTLTMSRLHMIGVFLETLCPFIFV